VQVTDLDLGEMIVFTI